ncbi:hypothetical protein G6011_04166 [Alternaria panax]|uniref:Uncharacterized protein n=1 Tax=Alternaria panax TaxID=48097 RepID=A0AAD4IGT2_9PLEO|nr:hypothetical protein G6011_04166 [Alternaria panax]
MTPEHAHGIIQHHENERKRAMELVKEQLMKLEAKKMELQKQERAMIAYRVGIEREIKNKKRQIAVLEQVAPKQKLTSHQAAANTTSSSSVHPHLSHQAAVDNIRSSSPVQSSAPHQEAHSKTCSRPEAPYPIPDRTGRNRPNAGEYKFDFGLYSGWYWSEVPEHFLRGIGGNYQVVGCGRHETLDLMFLWQRPHMLSDRAQKEIPTRLMENSSRKSNPKTRKVADPQQVHSNLSALEDEISRRNAKIAQRSESLSELPSSSPVPTVFDRSDRAEIGMSSSYSSGLPSSPPPPWSGFDWEKHDTENDNPRICLPKENTVPEAGSTPARNTRANRKRKSSANSSVKKRGPGRPRKIDLPDSDEAGGKKQRRLTDRSVPQPAPGPSQPRNILRPVMFDGFNFIDYIDISSSPEKTGRFVDQ